MASSVGSQLDRRLGRLAAELGRAQKTAVGNAALAMKRAVESERARVSRSGRLRNVGRSGAKLGVRYDLKGKDNPTAVLRATGPWQLIERDTKAHTIGPRSRRSRRGRTAVLLPDGGIRNTVQHPGTKGRRPWRKGIDRGKPAAVKVLRAAFIDAAKRGIRG